MKIARILTLLLCACLLSACGFRPQSRDDFPVAMRTLYFNAQNPEGALATEVRRRLLAAQIKLVDSPKKARVELNLKKADYKTAQPIIFYSGNAVSFSYTLSATYLLLNHNKAISQPRHISINRSLLHNANQGYTSGSDVLMRRELTQALATEIMFNLTSNATRKVVQRAVKDLHAIQRPAVL